MKRFRLVIPQFPYFNVYSSVVMPPLGAVSVATSLREFIDFEVELIDENNYRGPSTEAGTVDHRALQEERPAQYIGFYGGLTSTVPRLYEVARQYKEMGAVTIGGGVHLHALPGEALDNGIDYVVGGEGEYCLPELIKCLEEGSDPANVRGVIFRRDGRTVDTGQREPLTDLDSLPAPDFSLLCNIRRRIKIIPISRTRGCNFNCEFCSVRNHLGPCRSASAETAFRQIERYAELGYKDFFFTDDNFVQDAEGTRQLCRMLIDYRRRSRRKFSIVVQVRADAARDTEMLQLMREAGVVTLCIGYESPIDEELRSMKKGVTLAKLEEYTRILREHGFYIHGMFIFGYPVVEHNQAAGPMPVAERAREYLEFIRRCKIDTIQVLKPVPLPGTALRARLEAQNRVFPLDLVGWDKYDGNWVCFQPDEGCTPRELQHYATWVMRRMYHPLQIVRFLYMVPNYPFDLAFNTLLETWRGAVRFLRNRPLSTIFHHGPLFHIRSAGRFAAGAVGRARASVGKRMRNARLKSMGSLLVRMWKRNFRKERFYEVLDAATRRTQKEREKP